MRIRASQVAEATGGLLVGADVEVCGASFDSRTLLPGQLFVPIVADRDGHEFLSAAESAGAAAALSSRPASSSSLPTIEVADTGRALLELATWARTRMAAVVVGITGSVGKTSVKDLAVAAVGTQRRVAANVRSFNNEQGLPVTVLDAPDDTEVLILEMGMRAVGEIARLCAVGRPEIGVVTSVARAHTALLGSIETVARAKAELVEALPHGGTAILNADDERVAAMAAMTTASVVRFGRSESADIAVEHLRLDAMARPSFIVRTPWGSAAVRLPIPGAHMAVNAAAAIAVAGTVGVAVDAAADALGRAELSARRMQVLRSAGGGVVINDAYNANPSSMAAALEALAALEADRRLAVLGLMAELHDPAGEHRAIAELAARLDIELIAVDTPHYGVTPIARRDVIAAVGAVPRATAVLVKGSLVAGLGPVADTLAAPDAVSGERP